MSNKANNRVVLRPYQLDCITEIDNHIRAGKKKILLVASPGLGKCLDPNTLVMMYDGTSKMCKDIKEGDLLINEKSEAVKVLNTVTGQDIMYKVTPNKGGDGFICTQDHVLTLRGEGKVIDIPLNKYLEDIKKYSKYKYFYANSDNDQHFTVEKLGLGDYAGFKVEGGRFLLSDFTVTHNTEISAAMIKRALEYKFPNLFVVRGRNLVNNAVDRFEERGLPISVGMAGDYRYRKSNFLQVCSVDTMTSRGLYPFKGERVLIFLDEAHMDYKTIFLNYPDAIIIGMTGTPFSDMSNYEVFVQPIKPYEARDMGFLVQETIYCPHIIDTSAVSMRAGDFNKKELNNVVTKSAVVGNIVKDWKEFGDNRPTVCFCVSVEHSEMIAQEFRANGIPAVHHDANSTDQERKQARLDLISGKIKVICNVNIFSTGWDCPAVSCIILARPTWSINWYLQSVGRGMRPYPGKTNCIVLDNAGNVFRHGTHFKVRDISLEKPEKRKSRAYDTRVKTCEECFLVFDPIENECCPDCGWKIPTGKGRNIMKIDGKLVEYQEPKANSAERRKAMVIARYKELERARRAKGFREVWVFAQLLKDFSREEIAHLRLVTVVPSQFLPLPVSH